MIYSVTIECGDVNRRISADEGRSFLATAQDAHFSDLHADCGGRGKCGKCAGVCWGTLRSLRTGEVHTAVEETLLLCQFAPAGECRIVLPQEESIQFFQEDSITIEAGNTGLGLAVDIGTTTVETRLYDLSNGSMLASRGERNAQRMWGADVISRITACSNGELPALRDAIQTQILSMARESCTVAGRDIGEVQRISVAGNTVMEHIFADLDPTGIGKAPFTPVSLFGKHYFGCEYLPFSEKETDLYLCPCISGYVGGDISAGLLATGGDLVTGLRLYIDIGTNGEMALGNQSGWLTCATAAGPAFEGAEISCGMDGAPGAIDRAWAENGDIHVHVIGNSTARGLCGSGLVDVVAALLELGVIDESGRMLGPDEVEPVLSKHLFSLPDGQRAFVLQDDVYLSAGDVRQLQLAKAAIRAGADTLLSRQGKSVSDVTELVIAGGFGSFLDKNSALAIGLLPPVDPAFIRHAGNASVTGAALVLTQEGEKRLSALCDKCEYLELSAEGEFMDRYIDCMFFGGEET